MNYSEFEKRAIEAQLMIERINSRLDLLEKMKTNSNPAPSSSSTNDSTIEFKKSMLYELRDLRNDVNSDKQEADKLLEENKSLKAKVNSLTTENEKLNYRIKHLLRSLEEEENKNKSMK